MLDRVDRAGEAVVLVGRRVVRLSPLAVSLLDGCEDWTADVTLASALVAQFGTPPGGQTPLESTQAALRDLEAEGLVECD